MPQITMTAEELRPQLLALAGQVDDYPFLTAVEEYLAAVPNDDQMRAIAMKALARKGLYDISVGLARGCPPDSPNLAQMAAIADQLSGGLSSIVDWRTTDAVFTRNLEALRGRGAAVAVLVDEIDQAWQAMVGALTLHQAADGNRLVRGRRGDGRAIWLPAALDFAGSAETVDATADYLKTGLVSPFLVDGVGMGYLVPRLHALTRNTYLSYSPAIYIVETNLRALALVLRLQDWTAVLADERVFLLAGPSAWSYWIDLMERDPYLPEPAKLIAQTRWPGDTFSPAEEKVREVLRHRHAVYEDWRMRTEAAYADRDAAYWAKRFRTAGGDDPLRILCFTSRYTTFLQHSTRDLMAALERAGCRTKLVIEERDYVSIPRHGLFEAIVGFQPDLIFVLDHHRHAWVGRLIQNVPYICWIQDELPDLYNNDVGPRLGPLDFTIGFGFKECVLRHGYPAERFMPCNLAIEPAKFAENAGADRPDLSLRCDVAYVSHHSETPEALHARVREKAGDERLVKIMDAFYDQTRALMMSPRFNGAYDLDRLLAKAERQVGVALVDGETRTRLMNLYIRPLAERTLRHTTLAWVADWAEATGRTFHLYGRGWEEHPRFGRYARGVAEHGRHLGEIARAAAVSLHMGLNMSLHQRVLETLVAGGFVLVRFHPFDFFPPSLALLRQYVEGHGIRTPTRIAMGKLPPAYTDTVRRRAAQRGADVPDMVEITPEFLLEQAWRCRLGDRYYYADRAFPRFAEITFDNPESFARVAERYIADPHEREAVAGPMRAAVRELFTYDALVPRILTFVTETLQAT